MENRKVGAPPKYATVEEMASAIDDYFQNGIGIKKVAVGKPPNQQIIEIEVPTISGLCYYIGFESRQSFYDYEEKKEFSYTVKRARLFIENEYEKMLQSNNVVGAIFALKNMGWKDKVETGMTNSEGKDVSPITGMVIN